MIVARPRSNGNDAPSWSPGKRSETRWVSGVSGARDVVYCAVRPAGVRPAARNARPGGEGRRFVCSSGGQGTRNCRQMRAAGLPGPPLCGHRMPHRNRNRDKTGIRPRHAGNSVNSGVFTGKQRCSIVAVTTAGRPADPGCGAGGRGLWGLRESRGGQTPRAGSHRGQAHTAGRLTPRAGSHRGQAHTASGLTPRALLGKSLLGDYLTHGASRNPEVCVQRKEASGSRDLAEGEP